MPNLGHTGPEIAGTGVFEERFSMLVALISPEKPEASQVAAIEVLLGLAGEAPMLAGRVRDFLAAQQLNKEYSDHVTGEIGHALDAL